MGNTKQSEQLVGSGTVTVSKEQYDAFKDLEYECSSLKQQLYTLQTLVSDKEALIKDFISLIPGLIKGGASSTTTPAPTPTTPVSNNPVFFGNNFQNPQFVEDNLTKKPDVTPAPSSKYEELLKKATAQAKSTP